KTHIRVCRTLSCAMAGSYQVMENLCAATGIQRNKNAGGGISQNRDGNYSIEFVECLASCGTGPVCMVNDDLHESVQPDNASAILSEPPTRYVHEPHYLEHRLIFKNIGHKNWQIDIDTYLKDGGYEDLKKALKMSRTDIVKEVKTSGPRGRRRGAISV